MATETARPAARHQPWYRILYVQVLIAIALGVIVGRFYPHLGKELKPLGDGFIALIKMMIAPVIFCTVVHGISSMGDLKRVGRVGLKALIYFEVVSTIALAVGLIVGKILQPGRGFNIDPATIDPNSVATYVTKAKEEGIVSHLLAIIPDSYFGALARGDLLQVLLVSILSGFAVAFLGKAGEPISRAVDQNVLWHYPHDRASGADRRLRRDGVYRRRLRPRFVVEFVRADRDLLSHQHSVRFGRSWFDRTAIRLFDHSFHRLHQGRTADRARNLIVGNRFAAADAEDGASGASRSVVGLVVPTGYSFNLDGTNIYMTLATLFLAQATNTDLTIWQELGILGIAIITSKGASGVTGAGFITLAATLSIVPDIPIQSIAILVGIDKFMSECRALTNLIGNGVACIVISRSEGELDKDKLDETMAHPIELGEALEPGAS